MKSGGYIFNKNRCDFYGEYLAKFIKRAVDYCKYNVYLIYCIDISSFLVWRTNEHL